MFIFTYAGEALNYESAHKFYVSSPSNSSSYAVYGVWGGNSTQLSNQYPTKEEAMALLTELVKRPNSFIFWEGCRRHKKPKQAKVEPEKAPDKTAPRTTLKTS